MCVCVGRGGGAYTNGADYMKQKRRARIKKIRIVNQQIGMQIRNAKAKQRAAFALPLFLWHVKKNDVI